MRYMRNFRLGQPPIGFSDPDILPYAWVYHHLNQFASGLPFSLTLIAILLAHEFGHYFACRHHNVRATLPYLLPAPSFSGTFGAIIRLQSVIRSRAALITIGAAGPIAGFLVALVTVSVGLTLSSYAGTPVQVQAPLTLVLLGSLFHPAGTGSLRLLMPHPVLTASWIGLLITALNLIPAGQLDGGHILYAIYPPAHKWSTRIVIVALYVLGIVSWAGWLLWATILLMPGMRHPRVPATPLTRGQRSLAPICLTLLVLCGTWQPLRGFSILALVHELRGR